MRRIIRNLFLERKKIEEGKTIKFFTVDILIKIIRLMHTYSLNARVMFQERIIQTIPNFLNRLSYHLSEGKIKNEYDLFQLKEFFESSSLTEFLSTIELFIQTLYEECIELEISSYPQVYHFVDELNNFLAMKTIPFRIEFNQNLNSFYIDRINSGMEETNKKEIYKILEDQEFNEANEHFTNCLIYFAKRNYPESIEEAYLTIEKYLKIKVNNHRLDATKSFLDFKKIFDLDRGVFKIHKDKIKERVDLIYIIRSEIKSHSDKKTFDRTDFLEETARFQLNEVTNLVILLNHFERK